MGLEEQSIIDQLVIYWKKQKIETTSKALNEVSEIVTLNKFNLPDDFLYFYTMVNGMEGLYPNEMDEEGFLFYPLEELEKVNEKGNIFVFAEYMQRSWLYGVSVNNGGTYEIGIIPDNKIFKPITDSIFKFLALYLENSSLLYDYES